MSGRQRVEDFREKALGVGHRRWPVRARRVQFGLGIRSREELALDHHDCRGRDHDELNSGDEGHPGLALQAGAAREPVCIEPDDHRGRRRRDAHGRVERAGRRPRDRLLLRVPDRERADHRERQPPRRPGRDRRRGRAGGPLLAGLPRLRTDVPPSNHRRPLQPQRRARQHRVQRRALGLEGLPRPVQRRARRGAHRPFAGLLHPAAPHLDLRRPRPVGPQPRGVGDPARRQRGRARGQRRGRRLPSSRRVQERVADRLRDRVLVVRPHTARQQSVRPRAKPGEQVLCTNPAALGGGSGPVVPYLPDDPGGRTDRVHQDAPSRRRRG